MIPSLLGVGWMAAKAVAYASASTAIIAGLQRFHHFEVTKKAKTPRKPIEGDDLNVNTSEGASKRIERLRPLQETK